jgi:hypothetical protein
MCLWHVHQALGNTTIRYAVRELLKKIVDIVYALAKLHNFCIDCMERTSFVENSTSENLSNIVNSDLGHVPDLPKNSSLVQVHHFLPECRVNKAVHKLYMVVDLYNHIILQ